MILVNLGMFLSSFKLLFPSSPLPFFSSPFFIYITAGKLNLECTQASMKDLLNGADGWYSGIIGLTERNTGGVITYSNDLFVCNKGREGKRMQRNKKEREKRKRKDGYGV